MTRPSMFPGILCAALAPLVISCGGTSDTTAPPSISAATSTPPRTATSTPPRIERHHPTTRTQRVAPQPTPSHHTVAPRTTVRLPGVPAAALPIASLTPGVVLTTSAATVCVSGYASSVRDVPDSEKEQAYARYGIPHVPYKHEVDHLISLELGGSNAITNLWPEPYAGRWGARTKDVLENKMHDLVCSGSLSLARAQHMEATNWVAAYRKYVGAPPAPVPPTTSSPPTTSQPPAPTESGGSCEPGYSPCLPTVADLNCDDIPSDKTPVTVTGSDPYELDADGDGYGCDS